MLCPDVIVEQVFVVESKITIMKKVFKTVMTAREITLKFRSLTASTWTN